MEEKRALGKYYTQENPFDHILFRKWFKNIDKDDVILEPFSGANNIVKNIKDLEIENKWKCYDIEPSENNVVPEVDIIKQDTIENFPEGFKVCITNPPYLAKNSASRRHIPFPDTVYDDLYKLCLDIMLKNCKYVAAIIPESFITSGLFHDKLYGVISLTSQMFNDTDCPVCLALFAPTSEIMIYVGNEYVGSYEQLSGYSLENAPKQGVEWKFNDPDGNVGVKCVDDQKAPSIYFHYGSLIDPSDIKISSRAFTRISGLPSNINLDTFLNLCNEILTEYRHNTKDVFMTSFKGLRKDGKYRRRIDFKTIRNILNIALSRIK